ncbi:MAG: HAD family hydrolase [Actinobacteria bacterium]|nr:HAD family hydrolase [Actinomycetota bacterium]
MAIDGVTFDFWNTLYTDSHLEPDEGSRALRLAVLSEAVEACGGSSNVEALRQAQHSSFDSYLDAWRAGRHYGAHEHVLHVLEQFGLESCDGVAERTALRIEELGAHISLRLLPGAAEAIPRLAADGVKMGLISDTGLTPGRILVGFLERDGLLDHFSSLTFSDETGYPKPDPRMFEKTLAEMGVLPEHALHVGDTPRTDIAGALGMGMRAVRFAAVNDHDDPPNADAVIRDHRELLPLVADS